MTADLKTYVLIVLCIRRTMFSRSVKKLLGIHINQDCFSHENAIVLLCEAFALHLFYTKILSHRFILLSTISLTFCKLFQIRCPLHWFYVILLTSKTYLLIQVHLFDSKIHLFIHIILIFNKWYFV